MNKIKFVMGEIQTLAVDLSSIVDEWKRSEERFAIIQREAEIEEEKKKTELREGELLPRRGICRAAYSFDNELLNIRDRLNLLIDYLNQARVSQFTTPWEGR